MPTMKPVVYAHQRRKDGTYNVKIRVTHKGVHRHIPTTLVVKPEDLTRSLNIKNPQVLKRAAELIGQMQDALVDLNYYALESMSVDDVCQHIASALTVRKFSLDFFAFAEEYIATKKKSTGDLYRTAVAAFGRFIGKERIDINDISRDIVLRFQKEYSKGNKRVGNRESTKPRGAGAFNPIASRLRTIHEAAKHQYNDEDQGRILIPRSPFDNIAKETRIHKGQPNLGVEVVQRMIDDHTEEAGTRMALDVFLLSFLLLGMNLADLYEAKECDVRKGVVYYNRIKTKDRRADRAEMRVNIPKEAHQYIERLRIGEGSVYWLRALHSCDYKLMDQRVRFSLKKWAKEHDVEEFTMYAARHTFASLARAQACDKATVDEALAHVGEFKIADIYAERNWELINETGTRVRELFRWE